MTKVMSDAAAIVYGYSADKRKRRNQHREAAAALGKDTGFFSDNRKGTIGNSLVSWHLKQARYLKR